VTQTIKLDICDARFIRKVEAESGQNISRCYQCGKCSAGCPMGFAYDLQVNQIMRLIQAGQRERVLSSSAIWLCATCEACTARCPNSIEVAVVMDVCRHMARKAGKWGVRPVRVFGSSFLQTVERFGRAYELGAMALFMLRTGRLFTDVDLAPAMLAKGKLPLLPHRRPLSRPLRRPLHPQPQRPENEIRRWPLIRFRQPSPRTGRLTESAGAIPFGTFQKPFTVIPGSTPVLPGLTISAILI
jgi:heterodisulfide reductase subunit C